MGTPHANTPSSSNYQLTKARRTDECKNCALCQTELRVVSTEYRGKRPRIMFISEAPGREENQQGRPAIGTTGQILRRLVRRLNEDGGETNIAYANVVRCRPTTRSAKEVDDDTEHGMTSSKQSLIDRRPAEAEIGYCRHFLYRDIERLDPQYIVLLGDVAAHALAIDPLTSDGVNKEHGIHKLRGRDYLVRAPSGKEYPATATFHFNYISKSLHEGGLFAEDVMKAFWRTSPDYVDYSKRGKPVVILNTIPKVRKLLHKLRYDLTKDDVVALDFETTGLQRINTRVLSVGFAYGPNRGYVIPYQHDDTPWDAVSFKKLRRLFARFFGASRFSFGAMVAHNLKFEASVIMDAFGVVPINVPWECTLLRANTLNENRGGGAGYKLKDLVEEWLSFYHYHDDDLKGTVDKRNANRLKDETFEALAEYNAMDCYVEWRMYQFQNYYAEKSGYDLDVFTNLHRVLLGPSSIFASWLERNGMSVNKGRLRFLIGVKSPILAAMRRIERELYAKNTTKEANRIMLGQSKTTHNLQPLWGGVNSSWVFAISKPAARRTLLVDVLNLTGGQEAKGKNRTKKGQWRVNKDFYGKYTGTPEVDLISEWMSYDKLYGTYIKGIYEKLQTDPDMKVDARVRGHLNLDRAVTGRTSFDNPNLQNIPRGKTEEAKGIKKLFNSSKSTLLVCGDYSQAEVRWLAEITKDKKLIAEFQKVAEILAAMETDPTPENARRAKLEGDFHRRTSAQMFKTTLDKITKAQRSAAKEVVFGNIYGMGANSLATRIGNATKTEVSQDEAEDFLEAFFAQFPQAAKWLFAVERQAYKQGYVESPFGRRRHLLSYFLVPREVSTPHWQKKQQKGGGGKRNDRTSVSARDKDLDGFLGQEDRQARNSPIQGVASDTNLLACLVLMRHIVKHKKPWKIVNVVHDSIIAEIPTEDVEEYTDLAKHVMQDSGLFKAFGYDAQTPFVADFSVGPNWGDQIEVAPVTTWEVKCSAKSGKNQCKSEEVFGKKPKRCPVCSSKNITVELTGAPAAKVVKYWQARRRKG